MISLHNIFSIAKYERKTLFRSWFFRIFGALSMIVLFGMNFGLIIQDPGGEGWAIRALPGAIPYVNLLILNVAQAVIAVFLASDFLKRDKKLDTTEVIYMRSMTNGEYVIGKTLGNLQVFMLLNFAVVGMALIFNALAEGTSINWGAYVVYLALISIPTLVFIMGLSFLLMSVVRNQAITFVLILGYIGITLFLLQDKFYYIYDYMAFNIPMVNSEVVGFGNLAVLLVHRGIYLGLGIGFIFLTIFLLKRLPQSESMTWFSLIFSLVFIGGAAYLAASHILHFTNAEQTRIEAVDLNNRYVKEPTVSVSYNQLAVEHLGKSISVISSMKVKNDNPQALNKLIFSLNAGLTVSGVKVNGKSTPFLRDHHLVIISDQVTLPAGDSASLEISYAGSIDETYCYLDIDEETRMEKYGKSMVNVDKRYAFVQPEYVLLTREANWYPKAGVTYSNTDVSWNQPQFVHFELKVKTTPGMQAVSQGEVNETTAGEFTFKTAAALTQISLAIGPYKYLGIEEKGTEFGVWYFDGHDYFTKAFPNSKDTLGSIIAERFDDFKRGYNLEYGDPRLAIVEVPAQFKTYERMWTSIQEAVQPQQVYIPEKAYQMREADFEKQIKNFGRGWGGPGGRGGGDMTDQEKEIRVLQGFLRKFSTETEESRNFGPPQPGNQSTANPYFIFPMLYNFQNNIQSDRWPITNRVFEAYLKNQNVDMRSFFRNSMAGESKDVLANIALQDETFEQILADPDQSDIVNDVIKLKGDVLFSTIQWKVGQKEFQEFLHRTLTESRHKNLKFEEFDQKLNEAFGIEIVPIMDTWFKAKSLPGYLIAPVKTVKVKSGDAMKTMVSTKITNFSDVDGLVKLSFRLGGGGFGRGGGNDETIDNLIFLEAHQTKDLSYLINGEPRAVILNTMTSKNIPQSVMEFFREIPEDPKARPAEGEQVTDVPVQLSQPNETVVDNEDPQFTVTSNHHVSLLERLIVNEDKKTTRRYEGINWWRPSISWTAVTNSDFYGEYVRSAYYIKGGDGDQIASWHVPVKKTGYYDVYFHLYKNNWGRRGRDQKGNYDFTIHADDGAEGATLEIQNAETGWNLLGTYYFSGDTALIELTNKTELPMIFADAVKIVEQ